uniref:Putative scp gapr-1 like scp-like extracellular protein n=2 Tax=Ixodes ricinus TaxID=34613 RepID=V5H8I7_IXORI
MSTTLHTFIFSAIMLVIISEGAATKQNEEKRYQNIPRPNNENHKFHNLCLREHNKYRTKHHVPALKTDPTLYIKARAWAIRLAKWDSTSYVPHEKLHGIGENIYWMTYAKKPYSQYAPKAVKYWYDENIYYNYQTGGYSQHTAHFTQMVWKSTTRVGCAYAVSTSSTIFVVCKYSPQGNIPHEYQSNVLPP